MLGSGAMMDGDMPHDLMQNARGVCSTLEKAVEEEARSRGLARALFPALFPCNLLCISDAKMLYIAFTNIKHPWSQDKSGETGGLSCRFRLRK